MPTLRPAFSRPGFVTFKHIDGALEREPALDLVFARRFGLSIARCDDEAMLIDQARTLVSTAPLRLHVTSRNLPSTDEDDNHATDRTLVSQVEARLRGALTTALHPETKAEVGDRVLDVVVAQGEPTWLGLHTHHADQSPWPGGDIPLSLPPNAPSRAYLKLAQAALLSRAPLRVGDVALEIGSAPGGATMALLERGVSVLGVDPGEMDPHALQMVGPGNARLTHLRVPVGGLMREQLPERVHWLVLDVNLAPQVALHSIQRLVPPLRRHLCGMFLTLKLNDWSMADSIPKFLEQTRQLGLVAPRAVQLPANRQEIALFGLTERGASR